MSAPSFQVPASRPPGGHDPSTAAPLRNRSRPGWLWALAGGLVLVALVAFGGVRASNALAHTRAARALLVDAPPSAGAILDACAELDAARAEAGLLLPLAAAAGALPDARARAWAEAPDLAALAEHGCAAARTGAGLLADVDARPAGQASAALLGALRDNQTNLAMLGDHLASALDALERVDVPVLAAEPRLAPLVAPLTSAQGYLPEARTAALLAPRAADLAGSLLGGDRPRTYLLVGQNDDEPRATGGFIGTLGLLTVADGRITASDVRSSYLWDRPGQVPLPAPEPLQRYMNAGGWYLRDANWWLDFRRTAAQLLLLWEREQGYAAQVDGVIAIDSTALEMLLRAVGTVDVPELGGAVSADTAVARLDEVRRGGTALRSYADYHQAKTEALSALNRAIVRQVMTVRGPDLARVIAALARAADERHLLVWLRDPDLAAVAAGRGWDGRLDPGDHDLYGVVDTSLSYGKVAPFIRHEVHYQRRPDGVSTVEVTYTNTFQPVPGAAWDPLIDGTWWDWQARVFRREQGAWLNYARVVAPLGARLLAADGWDDAPATGTEGPVTIFGAPILVRPGQTRTVRVTYANPAPLSAPAREFRQPGAGTGE